MIMTTHRFKITLLLMMSVVALTGACSKQGDEARAQVQNISNNGCLSHTDKEALATKDQDDEQEWVEFSHDGGVLTITHHNMVVNCAFEANGIGVSIRVEGDTVTIDEYELDGPQANCICLTDNTFQIVNLPRGTYTFVFNCWWPSPYTCTYSF